jgi:hypothetical protein
MDNISMSHVDVNAPVSGEGSSTCESRGGDSGT